MNQHKAYLMLLAGLLFFAFVTPASAQVSFGIKLTSGVQISYFQAWDQQSVSTYTRMGLGAFFKVPLSKKIGLQPELTYLTYPSASLEAHTIGVPILITYRITPGLEIEAGPSLVKDFSTSHSSGDVSPNLNVGANTGVNFWFSKYWSANLRYTYELARRTYDNFGSGDTDDILILPKEGPEPGHRDMFITTSIRYSFR